MKSARFPQTAFTKVELLVVVVIVGLLVAFLIPFLEKSRAKAALIKCTGRVGCVGLAYRIYATDHNDKFPWQTNYASSLGSKDPIMNALLVVTNELSTPRILVCPADKRKAVDDWSRLSPKNISYFINTSSAQSLPQSILAADRNLTTNGVRIGSGKAVISWDSRLGWDETQHNHQGIAALADGSWMQLNDRKLGVQWKMSEIKEADLLVP